MLERLHRTFYTAVWSNSRATNVFACQALRAVIFAEFMGSSEGATYNHFFRICS